MERTPPRPIPGERLAHLARVFGSGRAPCFHKPLFETVPHFDCSVQDVLSPELGQQRAVDVTTASTLRLSNNAEAPQLVVYVPSQVRYLNKAPRMETAFSGMQHMLFGALMERLQSFLGENFDRLSSRRLDISMPVEQRDTQTLRFYEMFFVAGVYPAVGHVSRNATAPPTHCAHVWVVVIPPAALRGAHSMDDIESDDEDAPPYPRAIMKEVVAITDHVRQWFVKELCQMPLFSQIPLGVQ